jgi:hypothetical protein
MRHISFWAVLALSLLLPGAVLAQTVSQTVTGGGNATLGINLNVTVEQSITLELTGNTVDPSSTLSNLIAGTSADVDFGTVNTSCSVAPSTGACYRLTDETGARFVATLDAKVTATGDVTPNFDLGIEAAPVIGVNDKLFRNCGANGSCPTTAADTFWENPGNGTAIPDIAAGTGTELASTVASGTIIEHQLGIEVLDSQNAGALSLDVVYTATPN